MDVDKNLFAYDCAIVSIMKNAAPYVKEWLDYHLLAGVDHFYIYDNESEDNFKEILQPYIDAGIVTYIFYPGRRVMMQAFNDAIDNFKYFCRYIAFVDDDEFILPKDNRSIAEVTDEILFDKVRMGGLEISWVMYGSNGLKTAEINRGVLERFTRRAPREEESVKTIVDPRRVNFMWTPHFAVYFDQFVGIRQSDLDGLPNVNFKIADKIVMNHYPLKSLEEFLRRKKGTDANFGDAWQDIEERFNREDSGRNEVVDKEILKYRAERQSMLVPNGDIIKVFSARNKVDFDKIFKALTFNLLPMNLGDNLKNFLSSTENQLEYFRAIIEFYKVVPPEFFQGKLATFFTCWGVSRMLSEKYLDKNLARTFEVLSLNAAIRTLQVDHTFTSLQFMMKELPKLLALPYPIVKTLRKICIEMIELWKNTLRDSINEGQQLIRWKDILEWDYKLKLLKAFDDHKKNS